MEGIWSALSGLAGVIIGGLLALIPVCLQLRHASKEREKERQMTLRWDVYLFAAKEVAKKLSYLFNFYSPTEAHSDQYDEAIQQIDVIGGDAAVRAASDLTNYISQTFCELIPEKYQIDISAQAMQRLLETSQKQSNEVVRWLEEMKQYNLQGTADPQKWAIIKTSFDLADSQHGETLGQLRSALNTQIKLVNALAQKCLERTRDAGRLLTPFVIAMRKELNCAFDEEAFRQIQRVSEAQWKRNVDAYISEMKARQEDLLNSIDSQHPPDGEQPSQ